MARRRIDIEFTLTERGAYCIQADLDDLGVGLGWLLRELKHLSDDDILALFQEDDRPQESAGPEGKWGLLKLEPYLLICHLRVDEPLVWRVGAGAGVLMIARMYRRVGAAAAIAAMRRLEETAERRWREERQ